MDPGSTCGYERGLSDGTDKEEGAFSELPRVNVVVY